MPEGPLTDTPQPKSQEKKPARDSLSWTDLVPLSGPGDTARLLSDQTLAQAGKPNPNLPAGDRPPRTDRPLLPSPFGTPAAPGAPRDVPPGTTPERGNHHGGWPVRRFDDKPNGPGPGGPITNPRGPLDVPSPIVERPGTESDHRDSVLYNMDARPLWLTGALSGAATRGVTWGLDSYTGKFVPSERPAWAKYYRENMSPSELHVGERTLLLQAANDAVRVEGSLLRIKELRLTNLTGSRQSTIAGLEAQIPKVASDAELSFFQNRANLVRTDASFTRSVIMANAGTEAEVAARTKLFTRAEATSLATHADDYWTALTNRELACGKLRTAELSRDKAAARLAEAERGAVGSLRSSLGRGLAEGLGMATLTIGADMALDKALGNNPELKGYTSWGLQGVALPVVLLSRMNTPAKIATSLAVVGGSHLIDRSFGPPTGMFSTFARPNMPEVALITASMLAPIRDWRVKAGLVAGSWAAGRAYNLLNDRYEFEGKTQEKMQNDARSWAEVDRQERTESTFLETVSRTKRFALENENAATFLVTDWHNFSAKDSMLETQRGRAALMTGLGEARLLKGTRLDQRDYDRGDRALAGTNYDLGGEAANFFRTALLSLDQCHKFAKLNVGRSFNNRRIDEAEVAQYQSLKEKVLEKLDVIYGKHDLDRALAELRVRAISHADDLKRFGENLKGYIDTLNDSDPQFKSKLMRDLALIHVACGGVAADAGEKTEHFRKAASYYERSRELNDKAPDLEKLRSLIFS